MRVAAVQTTAGPDREDNLDAATPLVEGAVEAGAALVVLPEYFSVAGDAEHLRRHAEDLAGPTVTWAAALAARLEVAIVAGTFPERSGDPAGRVHNTSCLIGTTGEVEAVYRKIHLFDVGLEGTVMRESTAIAPGDRITVAPLTLPGEDPKAPLLGMSTCYDLRFPELYRILALEGATVVVVPAAFSAVTGPAHWELLLRARAVENESYVVAAGQTGTLPPGMPPCHGHSMIVDPWGTVLAEHLGDEPGFVVADADLERLEEIRKRLPVLAHRRPDTYRWPDGG